MIIPLLLVPIFGTGATVDAQQHKPLNIVHIMTDDHSYQTISAYGSAISKLAPTPNLDRLAARGMLFRRAYVENSLSTPSRACLMTGLYSHQNGQRMLGAGIDTTKTFFTEILQQHGYQTAIIGKWHMQCEPKGFDYYRVLRDQGEYYNPVFKTKDSHGQYIEEKGYVSTLITDHAIEFLDHRDKSKPFCLMIHHKTPHRNWMPDLKYLNLYEDVDFPLPETFYDDYSTRCDAARTEEMRIKDHMTLIYDRKVQELMDSAAYKNEAHRQQWPWSFNRLSQMEQKIWNDSYGPKNRAFINQHLTGNDLLKWKYERYLKDYLRCIKSIDDEVGRILDYLDKNGLTDNTVIVYTSDQGFYMGEHGWFDKRFMYEESFRTPLIISYPGLTKKGSKCDELVQNIDYAPTYLAIAGITEPDYMVGRSLIPILGGKTPSDWRKYLYYHFYDYPAEHYVRRHDGVRDDRYKLIHFYGDANEKDEAINCNEFYDEKSDPNELHNLYGDPHYTPIIARLQAQLDKFRKDQKVDEY